ncbi:MAG TPA: hypothetical protein VMA73_31610 [Streptosporangiaceae bacterium]|nr:hypothetical protein [Streptosporangiaceae bacterium]
MRNTVLAGAAATAAGASALSRPDAAQAASALAGTKVAYGAMHSIYPHWVANAPSPDGKNSERRYFDTINFIPKDWTAAACHSRYVTMSIRPNPEDLLNNKTVPDNGSGFTTLDGQITHLLSTCPDHAELTCWHEAQSDNPIGYPKYITAANMRAIHSHVQKLCSSTPDADGGRVKYGCILTGPVGTNAHWLGTHLDWYGIDIYDDANFQLANGLLHRSAIIGRMNQNLQHWRAAAGKRAVSVRITETNSAHDNHRKNWMLWLSQWMAANNGYRIVTFWGGPLSGNWPPSRTVLDYYRTLQRRYGA